jgi:hypothetical protein
MRLHELREVIAEEVRSSLREDYARGIPDFALSQVASETTESLKRLLKRNIQMTAQDPVRQRQMLAAANDVLEELEVEIKQLLEEKLLKYARST